MLVRVDNMITKQNASSFIDLIMPFKNDPYFNYKSDMLKLILLIIFSFVIIFSHSSYTLYTFF